MVVASQIVSRKILFFHKNGPNRCAYEYELLRILLNMTLLPMHTDVQTSHRGMSIDKQITLFL